MNRKNGLWMTMVLVLIAPAALSAQKIDNTSFKTDEDERIMRLETVLECSLDKAWELFATSEGVGSWMAPVVEIDFSNGGRWELSYDKSKKIGDPGNIINEIVCIVPKEMYVMRVRGVPDNFPFDAEKMYQVCSVVQFEKAGEDRTKLTLTCVGYREGPEWDRLYNFFVRGNSYTFAQLHKRIENGPVDWETEDDSEGATP